MSSRENYEREAGREAGREGRIRFVRAESDNRAHYQPERRLHKFHQICSFRDPNRSKYNVRTVIFNEDQEVVKVYTARYSADQCRALITSCRGNDYKLYQTYDLDLIDYPGPDDMLKIQSELLQD